MIGRANVPVGREGIPVGTEGRALASNVVVTVVQIVPLASPSAYPDLGELAMEVFGEGCRLTLSYGVEEDDVLNPIHAVLLPK